MDFCNITVPFDKIQTETYADNCYNLHQQTFWSFKSILSLQIPLKPAYWGLETYIDVLSLAQFSGWFSYNIKKKKKLWLQISPWTKFINVPSISHYESGLSALLIRYDAGENRWWTVKPGLHISDRSWCWLTLRCCCLIYCFIKLPFASNVKDLYIRQVSGTSRREAEEDKQKIRLIN